MYSSALFNKGFAALALDKVSDAKAVVAEMSAHPLMSISNGAMKLAAEVQRREISASVTEQGSQKCSSCGHMAKCMTCARCKSVQYCSKECQKSA